MASRQNPNPPGMWWVLLLTRPLFSDPAPHRTLALIWPALRPKYRGMNVDLTISLIQLKAAQQFSQIQYAVAAKLLQTERQTGANVIKLIEAAGHNLDGAAQPVINSANALDIYA